MGYRKVRYVEQLWHIAKYKMMQWLEWQDAKAWAKMYHPAWLHIAQNCQTDEVRQYYNAKILCEYRDCRSALDVERGGTRK